MLLHRARSPCGRVRVARVRRGRHVVGRRHARHLLRARLHHHGRHLEHHAQHPRRTSPRPPPLTGGVLTHIRGIPCPLSTPERRGRRRRGWSRPPCAGVM